GRSRVLRSPVRTKRVVDVDLQFELAAVSCDRHGPRRGQLPSITTVDDAVDLVRAFAQRYFSRSLLVGTRAPNLLAAERVEQRESDAADRFVVVPSHMRTDEELSSFALPSLLLGTDFDNDVDVLAGMTRHRVFGVGDDLATAEDAEEDLGLGVVEEFVEVTRVEVHVKLAAVIGEHARDERPSVTIGMTGFDLHVGKPVACPATDAVAGYSKCCLVALLLNGGHAAPLPSSTLNVDDDRPGGVGRGVGSDAGRQSMPMPQSLPAREAFPARQASL